MLKHKSKVKHLLQVITSPILILLDQIFTVRFMFWLDYIENVLSLLLKQNLFFFFHFKTRVNMLNCINRISARELS